MGVALGVWLGLWLFVRSAGLPFVMFLVFLNRHANR
jgi:hypothetical protein